MKNKHPTIPAPMMTMMKRREEKSRAEKSRAEQSREEQNSLFFVCLFVFYYARYISNSASFKKEITA